MNFYIYPPPDPPEEPEARLQQGGDDMIEKFMETTANVFAELAQEPPGVPAAALVWLTQDAGSNEIAAHCQAVSFHPQALGLLGYLGATLLAKQTFAKLQEEGLYDFDIDEDEDDDTE